MDPGSRERNSQERAAPHGIEGCPGWAGRTIGAPAGSPRLILGKTETAPPTDRGHLDLEDHAVIDEQNNQLE